MAATIWPRPMMDARTMDGTGRTAQTTRNRRTKPAMLGETITAKRDRLLASLTLIAGIGDDRRHAVRPACRC